MDQNKELDHKKRQAPLQTHKTQSVFPTTSNDSPPCLALKKNLDSTSTTNSTWRDYPERGCKLWLRYDFHTFIAYTCSTDECSKNVSKQTSSQRTSLARSCKAGHYHNFRMKVVRRRILQPKMEHQVSALGSIEGIGSEVTQLKRT